MIERERIFVLLIASCFLFNTNSTTSPLFILVAPPKPMTRILPTQSNLIVTNHSLEFSS